MTKPGAWKKIDRPAEVDSAILVAAAAFCLVWNERDERIDHLALASAKRKLDLLHFGRTDEEADAMIVASKYGAVLRDAMFSAFEHAFGSEPLP